MIARLAQPKLCAAEKIWFAVTALAAVVAFLADK